MAGLEQRGSPMKIRMIERHETTPHPRENMRQLARAGPPAISLA
jgi:hypothetical protein